MKGIDVLSQKIKNIWKILCYPWHCLKIKKPLLSFIVSRLATMLVMLFLLGFALFALMELAPGDIVDQFMTQQLMASVSGGEGSSSVSGFSSSAETAMSTEQYELCLLYTSDAADESLPV